MIHLRRRLPTPLRRFGPVSRLAIAALIALPLLTGAVGPAPGPAAADELSDARAQQAALQQQIAQQKAQMAQLNAAQQNLQAQIASTKANLANVSANLYTIQQNIYSLRNQVAALQVKYDGLVKQLAGLEAQLQSVEAQEAAKAEELRQRKDLLARRLVAAYETGQESLLEQVLSAKNLDDVLADVGYYVDMSEQDRTLAQQIQKDQATLAELHQTVLQTRDATEQMRAATAAQKAQLDAQMADLAASQARLAALQVQMQNQLAAQRAAESKLAQNQAALAAAIRSNGAAQNSLANKIQQLVAAQASTLPSSNGPLGWPMGGVITQPFGCTGVLSEPPLGSCAHFHVGIDIAAPYGTPVHSAGAGTVVFVGFNPYDTAPQAWIVIVAHSSGLQTWYAHMEAVVPAGVWVGARVARGQVIGYEGMTGHTSGPHLHWAVMLNGNWVNPRLYV